MSETVIERPSVLDNTIFYCKARRKKQSLEKCLDDYTNATAFENRKSACWHCPQGRGNRTDFVNSADGVDGDDFVPPPRKSTSSVNRGHSVVVPSIEVQTPQPAPQPAEPTPVSLPVEPVLPVPPAESPPPAEVPEAVPQAVVPPPHDDEVSDTTTVPTPEQEERGEMKLENRARKMSFTDRVRHAWNNTPGETAVEKQEYLFLRNATDALQQIFGLGSPAYAQLFMDRLRQNDLIIGTDGSYYWANDMSNYSETDGPKPGPRSRASEPPSEDVADDAGESTETDEVDSNDLHIVLARAPWMASVLRAAALLGQIAPDARILALEAIRKIAALPEENLPQALNTLNAIFHESLPAEEPEFE